MQNLEHFSGLAGLTHYKLQSVGMLLIEHNIGILKKKKNKIFLQYGAIKQLCRLHLLRRSAINIELSGDYNSI